MEFNWNLLAFINWNLLASIINWNLLGIQEDWELPTFCISTLHGFLTVINTVSALCEIPPSEYVLNKIPRNLNKNSNINLDFATSISNLSLATHQSPTCYTSSIS